MSMATDALNKDLGCTLRCENCHVNVNEQLSNSSPARLGQDDFISGS